MTETHLNQSHSRQAGPKQSRQAGPKQSRQAGPKQSDQERVTSDEARRSEQSLRFMRWARLAALATALFTALNGYLSDTGQWYLIAAYAFILFLAAAIARRLTLAGRLNVGIYTFVGTLLVVLAPIPLTVAGLLPLIMLGNIVAVLLAGLFISPRLVLRMTAIAMATTGASVLLELWSPLSPPSFLILNLVLTPIAILFTGYLIHLFSATLSHALAASQSYAGGLERTQAELVARTRELEATTADLVARGTELEDTSRLFEETARQSQRRADLLQASAQVSRAVAQIRDLDQLLPQVTQLISRHFGFYHAGIFLTDGTGRHAVLRAANSSGGQRMLARQHRLGVGSEGIVGYVTGTGQPRIALDVGADATYFDNPDLPDTRSEMALPLRTGGTLIGALDVQSTKVRAFDQEDIAVLTLMADQIATAIENARLFEQAQVALAEAEGARRHYLRQEWDSFLGGRSRTRFPQPPHPGRKR